MILLLLVQACEGERTLCVIVVNVQGRVMTALWWRCQQCVVNFLCERGARSEKCECDFHTSHVEKKWRA